MAKYKVNNGTHSNRYLYPNIGTVHDFKLVSSNLYDIILHWVLNINDAVANICPFMKFLSLIYENSE
jgi:hypothetical protein